MKALIIGLGKSGVEASRLLREKGYTVFITEIKNDSSIQASIDLLIKEGVVSRDCIEIGSHTKAFMQNADLVVASPGVRMDSFKDRVGSAHIISELELAYSTCPAPIIAVTGTSGKTTVTTLIGRMLEEAGFDTVVCGNIGNPFSGEIKRIKPASIVVLEVSSFQLEGIKTFKPKTSIILNISENHLDRHKDMEEYVYLKSRIFCNQDRGDFLFLNSKDECLKKISKEAKCRVKFFDEFGGFRERFNMQNDNYLASMSIASLEGVSEDIMLKVLKDFKGIEHRLEYVDTVNGVDFINDSKSTTIASVEWALKSLDGRITLIMGGRYKGGDFSKLNRFLNAKVDCVIAIGEARSRIKKELSAISVIETDTLKDAVYQAFDKANKCSKILLSPGCSSFDMFSNYEERGRIFKELVRDINSTN